MRGGDDGLVSYAQRRGGGAVTSLTFKRHYKLLVLLTLVVAVLIIGAGDQPIVAYSVQGTQAVAAPTITDSQPLAELANAADSLWIPGAVQDASAADSQ
jgi:hypothetical protein